MKKLLLASVFGLALTASAQAQCGNCDQWTVSPQRYPIISGTTSSCCRNGQCLYGVCPTWRLRDGLLRYHGRDDATIEFLDTDKGAFRIRVKHRTLDVDSLSSAKSIGETWVTELEAFGQ